jgi:hypothetical protein
VCEAESKKRGFNPVSGERQCVSEAESKKRGFNPVIGERQCVRQNPKSGDLFQKAGSASRNSTEGECATVSTKSTRMSTVGSVKEKRVGHWDGTVALKLQKEPGDH